MNYYNELDPFAAQWLRNLIAKGLLPRGEVDGRSIAVVSPDDLRGFRQCHFFAGIGGWPLAACLAGWPDDRELWTGSPPCQPFSSAGKGAANDDARHLWPHYFRLIAACRPVVAMGEQVSSTLGRVWFDGISFDLESIGYAVGAAIIPACAVNAPHRRERLFFVADADKFGTQIQASREHATIQIASGDLHIDRPGHWDHCEWITCHDGKARRIKPGVDLLAYGIPAGVGRLRAYGNAIVPQVAAQMIAAYLDCRP